MGKKHLFRIIGIGLMLLLLTVYFMLNPAKDTSVLSDTKTIIDSVDITASKTTSNFVELDTLKTININFKYMP